MGKKETEHFIKEYLMELGIPRKVAGFQYLNYCLVEMLEHPHHSLTEILEQYEKLGIKNDNMLHTLLLLHLSIFYYPTIADLEPDVIEALFVLAKELYDKYKPDDKIKLPYSLSQVKKAFDNNDYELWKLASRLN